MKTVRLVVGIVICTLLVSLCSCGSFARRDYTSKDVAILPCEQLKRFFFPIEFNESGDLLYQDQLGEAFETLQKGTVKDIYIFVHGWDKTASLAERDYQDFICRFHAVGTAGTAQMHPHPPGSAGMKDAVILGLFWPSTVLPNQNDASLFKPVTYYKIRQRADELAVKGFQTVLLEMQQLARQRGDHFRMHFIGHSFGGRVLIKGLFKYLTNTANNPQWLFAWIDRMNFVLLLPAMSSDALETQRLRDSVVQEAIDVPLEKLIPGDTRAKIYEHRNDDIGPELNLFTAFEREERIANQELEERKWRSVQSMRQLSELYAPLRVFTVYSSNDWANKYLFPMASTLTSDRIACALGGCGSGDEHKYYVDVGGYLASNESIQNARLLDIDATAIISSHTDIYKGRVASLIWQLVTLYPVIPVP